MQVYKIKGIQPLTNENKVTNSFNKNIIFKIGFARVLHTLMR